MEAPEFFVGSYLDAGDCHFFDHKVADNYPFAIDDLLELPKEEEIMTDIAFFDNVTGNLADSSSVTVVDSSNSSGSGTEPRLSGDSSCPSFTDSQLSGELCVPCDDLAELEWLSTFVEDSFSTKDLQNLQQITATKTPADTSSSVSAGDLRQETSAAALHGVPMFPSDVSVPGKARSKRSRAAPCDWSSRLLVLSPAASSSDTTTTSTTKTTKTTTSRKRESAGENPTRRCLHCASEKTPQWRTGPMGPKTLCNACGVRYKSGRLVPEYRPAASPTFVSTKHSNSHRKVLELRRQKDLQRQRQEQFFSQSSVFSVSNGEDYLIPRHGGPDFTHMI
ncbi:hypothetical protein NMG60_11002553 [Bertholletia excelsa]